MNMMPKVWASLLLATWSMPMSPVPPDRFSTMKGCPKTLDKRSAKCLAMGSQGLPAADGTTMRTGLAGQAWARPTEVRDARLAAPIV